MLYTHLTEAKECPQCGAEVIPTEEIIHEVVDGVIVNCPICDDEIEVQPDWDYGTP